MYSAEYSAYCIYFSSLKHIRTVKLKSVKNFPIMLGFSLFIPLASILTNPEPLFEFLQQRATKYLLPFHFNCPQKKWIIAIKVVLHSNKS